MQPEPSTYCLMIVPGNDGTPLHSTFWYSWLSRSLSLLFPSLQIILQDMPDPKLAREVHWLPYIIEKTQSFSTRFLVGHCSGALAIMRLLENYRVDGVFLLCGCVNDLGLEEERLSGYYPQQIDGSIRPWRWDLMRKNAGFIVFVGSQDDPFIPLEEMREIKEKLALEAENYVEFSKEKAMGHFMSSEFPELLEIISRKIEKFFC